MGVRFRFRSTILVLRPLKKCGITPLAQAYSLVVTDLQTTVDSFIEKVDYVTDDDLNFRMSPFSKELLLEKSEKIVSTMTF